MKTYTVEKVNLSKLYLFVILGMLIYSLLIILLISLITLVFPNFNNVNLVFIIIALFFVNYYFNFAYSKSSAKMQIKLNNKKMIIGEDEILLDNIQKIKCKGTRFNYYPEIIIELTNTKKINFRMSKNNDFDKLILKLKKKKDNRVLHWVDG